MTAVAKRYWQVWRSWSAWPVFQVLCLVMAAQLLLQISGYSLSNLWWQSTVPTWMYYYLPGATFLDHVIPTVLLVAVPILIVGRLKSQMTNWRSALLPDYREPHLTAGLVIGIAIFFLMAVLPIGLGLWRQYSWDFSIARPLFERNPADINGFLFGRVLPAIGFLAWQLFAALLFGWLLISAATWVFLPLFGVCIAICLHYISQRYFELRIEPPSFVLDLAHDVAGTCSLMFLDIVLLTGLWMRLANLPVGSESIRADERLPWLSAILVETKSRPKGGMMESGIWRRAGHRRLMGLGRRFIWLLAIYTAGLICLRPVLETFVNARDFDEFVFEGLFLTGVVSALAIGLSWPRRFAELNEVELMRPAPRHDCAREIGLAMLFDATELCIAMSLAILALTAFWMPLALHYPNFWYMLAAAVCAQAFTFGLLVWMMILRSTAFSMIALALAIVSITMLLYFALDMRTIAPALIAAAIGIALAGDAYRRWLLADLA